MCPCAITVLATCIITVDVSWNAEMHPLTGKNLIPISVPLQCIYIRSGYWSGNWTQSGAIGPTIVLYADYTDVRAINLF